MFDARIHYPLPAALAGGTAARVGDSVHRRWTLCMAHRPAPLSIRRGIKR